MESAQELANSTVYTEYETNLHKEITESMFSQFFEVSGLQEGAYILDLGCGMGSAWKSMRKVDARIVAISPNKEEIKNAENEGISCFFSLESLEKRKDWCDFDAIWARHSLEHTINPFETLLLMKSVLKDEGWVYVEVPSPDTCSNHEANPNHYSVLGDLMWKNLMYRAGFEVFMFGEIKIDLEIGKDKYFWYILRKNSASL